MLEDSIASLVGRVGKRMGNNFLAYRADQDSWPILRFAGLVRQQPSQHLLGKHTAALVASTQALELHSSLLLEPTCVVFDDVDVSVPAHPSVSGRASKPRTVSTTTVSSHSPCSL